MPAVQPDFLAAGVIIDAALYYGLFGPVITPP